MFQLLKENLNFAPSERLKTEKIEKSIPKLKFSNSYKGRDRDRRDDRSRDSRYNRDSERDSGSRREEPRRSPPPPPPPRNQGGDKERFVFDDFLQLSNLHPPVSKVRVGKF